jgi:hypothetical protein
MTNQKQLVWIPLFWGSIWGLAEATLGHILHWMPIPGIAGYVMFPIGMFFLVQAFRHSGKLSIIFLTALVAANIKLIDFFLPVQSPFAVINPAVAILCESLAVGLFFWLKDFRIALFRLDVILGMALVWRLFYGVTILLLGFIFPVHNFTGLGSAHIFRFFLLESSVNAILIYALFHKYYFPIPTGYFLFPTTRIKESSFSHQILKHPALITVPIFVVAIAVEFFLT